MSMVTLYRVILSLLGDHTENSTMAAACEKPNDDCVFNSSDLVRVLQLGERVGRRGSWRLDV
jgi:hypothetical protein